MLLPTPDPAMVLFLTMVLVSGVLTAAGWVYRDARAHHQRGTPIACSFGTLRIATPAAWFVACVLLCELFLPAYLDNRRPA
jgi:hypothetical protein